MLEARRRMGKLLSAGSARLVGAMELTFYTYGRLIATSPIVVIVVCLVMAAGCGVGLLKFQQENRPTKLWTPEGSESVRVQEWMEENFGSESVRVQEWMEENFVSDTRLNMAIYEADNVLKKNVLLEMLRVHELLTTTTTSAGATWNTTCWTVPAIPTFSYGRRRRDAATVRQKRQTSSDFDFSRILPRDSYCELQESLQEVCLESGLLDVFGYDRDFLTSLTQEQILDEINDAQTSSITGFPINIFFGVCVYGLYHGLVFLPVLLSLIGPASHNAITPQHLTPPHTISSTRSSHPLEQKNGKFVEKSLDTEGRGMPAGENKKGVGEFTVDGESKVPHTT